MKKRTLLLTLAAFWATTAISANEPTLPFTAAVKENGMWGAVNGAGQVVIPISYDHLGLSLSEADEQKEGSFSLKRGVMISLKQKKADFADSSPARERKSSRSPMKAAPSGKKALSPSAGRTRISPSIKRMDR